jgi:hypothetical protein
MRSGLGGKLDVTISALPNVFIALTLPASLAKERLAGLSRQVT